MRRVKVLSGFSLIELTLCLFIVSVAATFLIDGFILDAELKAPRQEDAKQIAIQQAIETYLRVNLYLPCPDTDSDGRENRQVVNGISVCADREGTLPYRELDLPATDAWGNPYYYRVHQRAESASYVNQVCETASVFGKFGARGINDLWFCPSSHLFYCVDNSGSSTCDDVCAQSCVNSIDPRPPIFADTNPNALAPYFHVNTPPYGTRLGSYNLLLEDVQGQSVEAGIIAVVISWGQNGSQMNRKNCSATPLAEHENCNGDRKFIYHPSGKNKDYVLWFTVNQAKMSLVKRHAFE